MAADYIINKELEETIKKFKEARALKEENPDKHSAEYEQLHQKLATYFRELSTNILFAFGFRLIDYDDAIQEGVLICLQKLDQFNPDLGTAFTYYTTCIYNRFCQLHRTSKTQIEIKRRYHEHLLNSSEYMCIDFNLIGNLRGKFKNKRKF